MKQYKMGLLRDKLNLFSSLSLIKTLRFNLRYFPFSEAMRFPVLLSRKVSFIHLSGQVKLEGPIKTGMIRLGFKTIGIFDYSYSRTLWDVYGTVVFKGEACVGQGVRICTGQSGTLTVGQRFSVTAESTIIAYDSVQIGDDCLISWDVLIMDTDFHQIKSQQGEVLNAPCPVLIGNNVWIGCRSLILKGSCIPDASIVGASSMVNCEISEKSALYAGLPVKMIRKDVTWNR